VHGRFVRGPSGDPEIVLDEPHRHLLADLCRQLADLVAPEDDDSDPLARELGLTGLGSDPVTPEDPVLARLLPDAYRDDPAAASEFRRYTEADLRLRKREHARVVQIDLAASAPAGHVVIDGPRTQAWLGALNDLRLALGTNLGVEEDLDEFADQLPDDDPRLAMLAVYHWLGLVQDTLVGALMPPEGE
jgi:hypothetical protein